MRFTPRRRCDVFLFQNLCKDCSGIRPLLGGGVENLPLHLKLACKQVSLLNVTKE